MTRKIANWVRRGAEELNELGPYAPYALAAILPGGSILAAAVWLHRHPRGLRSLYRSLALGVALAALVLLPGCV